METLTQTQTQMSSVNAPSIAEVEILKLEFVLFSAATKAIVLRMERPVRCTDVLKKKMLTMNL